MSIGLFMFWIGVQQRLWETWFHNKCAETRSIFNDKSEKCIFIGYDEPSKSYRLFNPIIIKFIVSTDVVFKEGESWDGNIDINVTSAATIRYVEKDRKNH